MVMGAAAGGESEVVVGKKQAKGLRLFVIPCCASYVTLITRPITAFPRRLRCSPLGSSLEPVSWPAHSVQHPAGIQRTPDAFRSSFSSNFSLGESREPGMGPAVS